MNAFICFNEAVYHNLSSDKDGIYLLVFGKVASIKTDENHFYIPIEPINCSDLVRELSNCVLNKGGDIYRSVLNNSYFYGAATVAGVCKKIQSILIKRAVDRVELHGTPAGKYIPLYFTAWGESSKNVLTSCDCFYEYVAESLADRFEVVRVSYQGKLSAISVRMMRFLLVPIVCFTYSFKSLRFRLKSNFNKDVISEGSERNYFLIRTVHQFNIAQNIISSLGLSHGEVVLVELESLSSKGLVKRLKASGYRVISPYAGVRGLVLTLVSILKSYWGLLKIRCGGGSGYFSHGGVKFQLKDLMADSMIQPQILMYSKLIEWLKTLIAQDSKPRVFSFEQVSPHAYFDHAVLDESADLFFVKSTLIQAINMPAITWGRHFLVNDSSELELRDCSYLNKESIAYRGSPKYTAIYGLKSKLASHLSTVLFATQPHEPIVNLTIIDALVQVGKREGFVTVVRKHPRDKGEYPTGGGRWLRFDDSADLYPQLASVDLVISRTSTVLEECIYIGVPYLGCIFSEKDRSYSAAYLDRESGLVIDSVGSLLAELSDYHSIKLHFELFRRDFLNDFKSFSLG